MNKVIVFTLVAMIQVFAFNASADVLRSKKYGDITLVKQTDHSPSGAFKGDTFEYEATYVNENSHKKTAKLRLHCPTSPVSANELWAVFHPDINSDRSEVIHFEEKFVSHECKERFNTQADH